MIDLNLKQRNVLKIIQRYPKAADDEALLLERYWIEIDGYDETKSLYWNLQRVTRPETISRRRRELYNLGLITYSADVLKEREEAFRNELSKPITFEDLDIVVSVANKHAAVSWMND